MEPTETQSVQEIVVSSLTSIDALVGAAVPIIMGVVVAMVGLKFGKKLLNKA